MANLVDAPVGDSAVFYPYLVDSRGRAITTFTGSESVRARVWKGDDVAVASGVVTLTFDATMAATGKTTGVVNGSATAALTPGYYRVLCEIQVGSDWFEYSSGYLLLKDAPGAATVPSTYCTLQECMDLAGDWLVKLMTESGRTDFIAERAKAREHIDTVILNHCRNSWGQGSNWFVNWAYSSPLYGSELPDTYVKGLLEDGDKLIQTDQIKSAAAYYTLFLVCQKACSWEAGDTFIARSRFYKAHFDRVIFSTVAQFDTDADGEADFGITLARFSIR